jgi:hypothetical protein
MPIEMLRNDLRTRRTTTALLKACLHVNIAALPNRVAVIVLSMHEDGRSSELSQRVIEL